jgi:Cu(I)/Ag(I) efflux system membrane fusion protein
MNKGAVLLGVLGLSVGFLAGYVLFKDSGIAESAVQKDDKTPLFYRNPMNPEITSPVPAKGSMGMDYIPVYAEEGGDANPGTVRIDPLIQANIGLRTAVAKLKPMSRTIRAAGRVVVDEETLVKLHPKVEGWIRDIRINKIGQPVSDDDILLTIYSPKLVATQQEYLLALKNYTALKNSPFDDIRAGALALLESSRERLVLLDVPEHQIVELEQSHIIKEGLHIHAPAGGTVLKIGARQGQFVSPGTELYVIADLSAVWVYADIYEYELPWVSEGDSVEMTLVSVPGRTLQGEVDYIYPYAEAKTRTTKVRMIFDNTDRLLRPDMFAEVSIKAAEKPAQVVVPAEAVVRSGDYDQIFVMKESGGFEPRRVMLGVESSGEVAVESGVDAGERVVVSGQFLVDSESKLREATAKMMSPAAADSHEKHDSHEGMQHD